MGTDREVSLAKAPVHYEGELGARLRRPEALLPGEPVSALLLARRAVGKARSSAIRSTEVCHQEAHPTGIAG